MAPVGLWALELGAGVFLLLSELMSMSLCPNSGHTFGRGRMLSCWAPADVVCARSRSLLEQPQDNLGRPSLLMDCFARVLCAHTTLAFTFVQKKNGS